MDYLAGLSVKQVEAWYRRLAAAGLNLRSRAMFLTLRRCLRPISTTEILEPVSRCQYVAI